MSEHTTSPGRMVDTNSRTAAFLRHAGLHPTDVPGEGPWVTMAQAQAEAARRGITVTLPDPLPPLAEEHARPHVRRMRELGAHLMRLWEGSKRPVETAWQDAPALTEDEAVDWLIRGNNLGVNLLRSGENGWLVLDAENGSATATLIAAGFVPTAVTANAQDPTNAKLGGSHVWMALPPGVDPFTLKSTLQIKLGAGVLDVLAGVRYVVAPGTRLDSTPGYRYRLSKAGAVWGSALPRTPDWLFDAAAAAPAVPDIEPLRGIAATTPRRDRAARADRADTDRITREVDEISWDEWLAGDPRVQILGGDGACGCDVFHWAGASTQRSGILHDGCEYGYGMHAFSGTLISQLGRDHVSRLDFAAWLRGRGDDVKGVAAEFGIGMGPRTTGFTAEDIARMTAGRRTTPSLTVLPGGAGPAAGAAPPRRRAPVIGSVTGLQLVDGASALDVAPVAPQAPVSDDDAVEAEEEDTGIALFRKIDEIDATGFWDSLPILRRVSRAAITNGVGRWGLLGAVLPRIACTVPPNVRLVGASGREGGQNSGASLNLNAILTGPPEEGKSETIKLSQDLVTLPAHAVAITTGTGEGIVKSFCYTKKADKKSKDAAAAETVEPSIPAGPGVSGANVPPIGSVGKPGKGAAAGYEAVHITDTVMLTAGEVSGMIAEMHRQGTKATGVYRSAWVGEELGTTAGEVERRTYLAPHTYRFGAVLGAQVDIDALGAIFEEGKLGSPQRFLFLPANTAPAIGEPARSIDIPPIDWYGGQAPAAAVGSLVAPHPPVFIPRPPAAHEEIEANREARRARRHLAYSVAEVRRRSEDDDEMEDIRGHELLHQLKLATVLAIGDGLRAPTDEYWHAARVIMHVRDLIARTLLQVISAQRGVADRKRGRSQGRSQAEARRAEAEAKQEYLVEVATRIVAIIHEKGAPASEAEIFRKLGKAQASVAGEALAEMLRSDVLYVSDHNAKGRGLYWIR